MSLLWKRNLLLRSSRRTFTTTTRNNKKPVAVFLNAGRLNYDQELDFSRLEHLCDLRLYPHDKISDPTDFRDALQDNAEIVITKEMEVSPQIFNDCFPPSVKLLCEAGTGYNNLPLAEARRRGVAVCNVPEYSTNAVAQMAVTYLMNFSVSLLEQQRMLQLGDRRNFTGPFALPLRELGEQATMGLIGGGGSIGSRVADICLALGMKVIISSRAGTLPESHRHANNPNVTVVKEWEPLLQNSDYVSIHCPLNDETRGSFGRTELEQMKPTAYLINTSRGAIVREDELIDCLQEKIIAGAGLDVTTTEPPSPDSPLWDLSNAWLSPHTGWRRLETRQRLVDMTADSIQAYCDANHDERNFINVVN